MTIQRIKEVAHKIAKEKGFWESDNFNVSEKLMLIVSEVAEAQEADRKGHHVDIGNYVEKTGGFFEPKFFEQEVKNSFGDELADVIIRVLDLCAKMEVDIETHILLKLKYNKTRPFKHGKKY